MKNQSEKSFWWYLWRGLGALLLLALLAYALNWAITPFRVADPERIQMLSRQANDEWAALQSQRANVDNVDAQIDAMLEMYGEDKSVWPQGKDEEYLQLLTQRRNMTSAYNAQCARYRSMWADTWQGIVAPSDLPTTCDLID